MNGVKIGALVSLSALALVSLPLTEVDAASSSIATIHQSMEQALEKYDSNGKAVKLPTGEYIVGNIDKDDEAQGTVTTMKEVKDSVKQNRIKAQIVKNKGIHSTDSSIKPLAAQLATDVKTVAYSKEFVSQAFSGSGWRYAGFFYKPQAGTGAYLAQMAD